jgi:hypothetical protein
MIIMKLILNNQVAWVWSTVVSPTVGTQVRLKDAGAAPGLGELIGVGQCAIPGDCSLKSKPAGSSRSVK